MFLLSDPLFQAHLPSWAHLFSYLWLGLEESDSVSLSRMPFGCVTNLAPEVSEEVSILWGQILGPAAGGG